MRTNFDYKSLGDVSTHLLLHKRPEESAFITITSPQKIVALLLILASVVLIALYPKNFFIVLNFIFMVFYLIFSFYKLFLITLSVKKRKEIIVSEKEIKAFKDEELPVYTILIPLYHETESISKLTRAMKELDYPKEKLDIKLLLEEDDDMTIEYANRLDLPPYFEKIIVPHLMPKTKPKACNLGLYRARGEYLVIYDAEDRPEPDQLKKAIAGFKKVGPDVICLQAKLNFYNRHQNILTKWFASEYSTWFDLYLPGLGDINSVIPLGGTSNHFKTSVLNELYGWDPYNVAEDCDLGVRLYRRGYRTQMLDSTTWEEACSKLPYWIRQRSRWIKGYIQTYLVHSRNPLKLFRDLRLANFINFQMVIGGNFFCFLLNPIYWLLAALWFLTRMKALSLLFPPAIFAMGSLCLFVGNFSFIYIAAVGSYIRKYYELVKYSLIIFPYWVLMSIGAWKGFLQLVFKPHYWEKTKHGLHLKKMGEEKIPKPVEEPL